ncbi:unnamed protein product, partial [Enterobius vermicularis]|uniref:Col_cuticle_N domain-containing protein n=1 Tax=Enterobius vermicularis TaxID=51028 RepID=A0A0N4UT97_ENTVE
MELKESDEHRQMRRVAFVAVVVSTAAVIASIVTLPMLYNYVQSFQSHLIIETDYCKSRARDMWLEMTALQAGKRAAASRMKRGWLFGQWVPEKASSGGYGGDGNTYVPASSYAPAVVADVEQSCCTCNQVSCFKKLIRNLRLTFAFIEILFCFKYLTFQGPAGPPGPDGEPGEDGKDGEDGSDGRDGKDAQ